MTQPRDWPQGWTNEVGRAIARARKAQGMSAEAVSARTVELGHPIQRAVLSNIENGRRPSIAVHEVAVIAEAIGVLPITLLFPRALDRAHPQGVEYLPGQHVVSWMGRARFNGQQTDLDEVLQRIAEPARIVWEETSAAIWESEQRLGISAAPEPPEDGSAVDARG